MTRTPLEEDRQRDRPPANRNPKLRWPKWWPYSLELRRTEGKLVEFQERERELERSRAESTHPAQEKPPPEAPPTERPNLGEKAKEEPKIPISPREESSRGAPPEREESEVEVRWSWHERSRAEPKEGRGRESPPLSRRESDRGDESDSGGHDDQRRTRASEGRRPSRPEPDHRPPYHPETRPNTTTKGGRGQRADDHHGPSLTPSPGIMAPPSKQLPAPT